MSKAIIELIDIESMEIGYSKNLLEEVIVQSSKEGDALSLWGCQAPANQLLENFLLSVLAGFLWMGMICIQLQISRR